MNTHLLIDAIVRQTTVLLAQLSTAAGIRAPLSHVADGVFVSLAREIEAQGVGRKVAADMFGLALRTYQKKVQRLQESASQRERTLWEAVLDFVAERGRITRQDVLRRFSRDGEREVVAVLTDLVGSGLVHAAGRGASAVYGVTTEAERQMLLESADAQSLEAVAWATIRATPGITRAELRGLLRADPAALGGAIDALIGDGRVEADPKGAEDARLRASPLVIPVGADAGWEAAVLDHFSAVAKAIAAKVRRGKLRSESADSVGGATLSFVVGAEHPLRGRVEGLLNRVREEVNALWNEVEAHNEAHPSSTPDESRVWFYFGQFIEPDSEEES